MGETTLPNIQYTGLRDCCCAQTLQPSDDANPCSWQKLLLANINDDEDCFVGQAPHIAGLCHRSHKQGVCDPGPGRGDPPKPLLAVTLIMQSGVFQSNSGARLSTAARPPLCSGVARAKVWSGESRRDLWKSSSAPPPSSIQPHAAEP